MTVEQRCPSWPDLKAFQEQDVHLKARQQTNYDKHHLARQLSPLPAGSPVFLPDRQQPGNIVCQPACRSYIVSTPSGEFRRNRRHINPLPLTESSAADNESGKTQPSSQAQPSSQEGSTVPPKMDAKTALPPAVVVTRSGRVVKHQQGWTVERHR